MNIAVLICGVVLTWSGTAKLIARPNPTTTLQGLDLPATRLFRGGVILLPLIEVAFGIAWMIAPASRAGIPAIVSSALFAAFLAIVIRARVRGQDATCACFGAIRPISNATVLRNLALLVFAVAGLADGVWRSEREPGLSALGALFGDIGSGAGLVDLFALAAVTLLLLALDSPNPAGGTDDDFDLAPAGSEYGVAVAPEIAFLPPGGGIARIDEISSPRGAVLLVLSEGCALCETVRPRVEGYRTMLFPMQVFVVSDLRDDGSVPEDADLGDLAMMASAALGATTFPSAVIVLPNRTIPMAPVLGPEEIDRVIADLGRGIAAVQGGSGA